SHADDRVLLWPQNAARDELQDVLIFANDDSVAGVVAACNPDDVVKRPGKIIDNFAFALVTPLRADHHHRFHPLSLSFYSRVCKYKPWNPPTPFPRAPEEPIVFGKKSNPTMATASKQGTAPAVKDSMSHSNLRRM